MTTTPAAPPTPPQPDLAPYDAVLLLSFGGPTGPDDVMPFLRRVTAGRGVPDERLALVAEHYRARGGTSPISAENARLRDDLQAELRRRGHELPVLRADRHTAPLVVDALREAHVLGAHRVVTVVTSAYPSYSGCRQYREDLATGWAAARDEGIVVEVDKLAPYAALPAFRAAQARLLGEALAELADLPDEQVAVLFVTHSIPLTMDELSGPGDGPGHAYTSAHLRVAEDVLDRVTAATGRSPAGELVFCSRSGPPSQEWLEPDVNAAIRAAAEAGARAVVVAPIGFLSDHMEVVNDLDTEAAATAAEVGLRFVRVPTAGRTPELVAGLVDLLEARAAEARGIPDAVLLDLPSDCAAGCCPNLREAKPALCGSDR